MYHNGYLNRRSDSRRSFALAAGLAAVFLFFLAILPAFAWADDAGFLAKVEGRVDILRSGQMQAVLAMENDPVAIGDVVRTKSGGRVEIHFNDDTVLRLAPGSRLKIDKYVFNPDNTRKSAAVTLLRGKLRAVVTKASSVVPVSASTTTFNINTPTAVAGVLGTDLFVFYDGGATGVLFKDGHGIVFNPNLPDQVVRVSAGFVTFITSGTEPPLEPRQATALELAQHVKDTTVGEGGGSGSGGPSAGGDNLLGYIPPPPDDGGGDGGPGAWLTPDGSLIPVTVYDPELLGDTTPPVITLSNEPGAYYNKSFANILISTNEPATFTYTFNGVGAITTSLSTADTFNIAGLPEGLQYTFTVVAKDAKGNVSDPMVVIWITDYTPPAIVMTTAIPSLTNVQTTDFSLTSSEPVNYTYLLDGAAVGTPTPLVPVEGPHVFTVVATDRAGNTSNTESYSWNSDYTAPNILSAAIPNPVSSQPAADVSLTVDDPSAALTYSLDGGAWTSMSPTLNLAGLAEGAHTIAVQATDPAGNVTVQTPLANWFYGGRAYTLDGLVTGTGAITTGTASGDLAVITAGTQGGWNMGFTPAGTGNASWTAAAGGKGFDAAAAFNGYWAYNGVYDGASSTGSADLRYLSYTAYGTGMHTGSYDASTRSWNIGDFAYGTYTETPLDFSGDVWGGLLWYDPAYGTLRYANASYYDNTPNVNGIIGLVGNLWATGSAEAHLMGTYNTYSGAEPYLIYGSGWYMNYDPTVLGYSTSLGGAFNGYNVGVWNNGVTKSNAVAIYIDPSGNAGYLKGGLSGSYNPGTGIWEMNGPVSTQFMETTAILPADLAASLATGHYYPYGANMSGAFASTGGSISSTYMEGSLKGLIGHNWGVWNGGMAGDYDTANTSSAFSAEVGSSSFNYDGRSGYMLGSMSSSNWGAAGNSFTGSLSTQFMTQTLLGNMTTEGLYGTFDPATGYWQSSMVGTWQATPLTHVSDISTGAYYIGDPYGYGYSYSVYDASINGLLGGTDSLWASASTPVTFMGGYAPVSTAPHIWGTEFGSYDYVNYTDTTYDAGAYHGYITGTEANGALDSLLYALYVDPLGNVGYLKGSLSGAAHPDLGMFGQTGTLNRVEMASATGVTAADFYNSIYFGYGGEGQLSGPALSGYDNGLYTMTLVDPQTSAAQNWGLYYHEFQGSSVNPAANWTAKAGGNDGIGVINPYVSNNGASYYADGGYYSYTYYSNNNYGSQNYFRPSAGAGTSTIYYSDGSTWINNYAWGDPYGYGYSYWYYTGTVAGAPWDPATTSLSTLATPLDSANVTSSDAPYIYVGGSSDRAYWLMDVTGSSWANGRLTASATGKFLSHYSRGTLAGDLGGVYDPATGEWLANGVGIYEATPLAFGGDISGNYYSFDNTGNYCYYCLYTTDWMNGYFGATQSPFSTPDTLVDLYLMGNNYHGSAPGTWWNSIEGGNYVDTASHWYGWMAGVSRPDNTIGGMLEALYIDASGNAGILDGAFTGVTHPDLSMFDGQGTLTARQLSSGYDPALYWNYVNTGSPDGYINGQFAGNTGYVNSAGYTLQSIRAYLSETATYWFTNPNTGLDEPWGIYKLELGGEYDNPAASTAFSMVIDGNGWKNGPASEYWLAGISGNWNADQTIDGVVNGTYMTPFVLGQINGKMYGSYDTVYPGTWEGVAMGDFTETTLAWSGVIDYDYNDNGLYNGCDGLCGVGDTYGGLAGGVQSPWSGTTSLTLMGPYYSAWQPAPYLWNAPIYSYNQNDYTYTTYDGGAFWGLTGGVWQNGTIDAAVYALYIDPVVGNAGILKGSLAGSYYTDLGMFKAEGQWTPIALTTGLDPATLGSLTYSPDFTWWTSGLSGAGSFAAGGAISEWQTEGRSYSIPGENWGISQNLMVGSYSDPASDIWSFSFNQVDYLSTNVIGTQTDGTQWSNGVLKGQTYGYGADIAAAAPKTWISVGETFGTFDATNLTWQAAQTSAWIETSKYLAMMQTVDGRAALDQLKIPFVEVGRTDLTGTDGNLAVSMNNVVFLAPTSDAAPRLWATDGVGNGAGGVTGTYGVDPTVNTTVALSGSNINADFTVMNWTGGAWLATINGGGTPSGAGVMDGTAITMSGAGAGTYNAGTLDGTAAGTVQ